MKKAINIILNILSWIILLFALLITIIVFSSEKRNGIPEVFGRMPLSVQTDSMSPTFKAGDLIIVKEIDDLFELKEGDVITYYTIIAGSRQLNTHRIIAVHKTESGDVSFTTRGDNNSIQDELPAYSADIVGKWTGKSFSGMGKVLDYLRSKEGFFICIIIPVALFFLFELYKFIAAIMGARQSKGMTSEEEEEIKKKAVEEYLAKQKEMEEAAAKAADGNTAGDKTEG